MALWIGWVYIFDFTCRVTLQYRVRTHNNAHHDGLTTKLPPPLIQSEVSMIRTVLVILIYEHICHELQPEERMNSR